MTHGRGKVRDRENDMTLISVSIVTFNTWDDTSRCVEAVLDSDLPEADDLEVLIHDNGIEPPEEDRAPISDPRVTITRSAGNLGFGMGHNENLATATGDFFFILNPDARPEPSAIGVLVEKLCENESLGAVSPQLRNEDGSIQRSCRCLPRLRYEAYRSLGLDRLPIRPFSAPLMNDWAHDTERLVEQPAGAALMLRTEDLRELEGFSREFPLYFEDVDLCRRVGEEKGEILFTPQARVVHSREGTAGHFRKETTFWIEWSRAVYYRKVGARSATKLTVRFLTLFSALTRMSLLYLRSIVVPNSPRTSEDRAKAHGYGLVLSTVVLRDENRWRQALLHR